METFSAGDNPAFVNQLVEQLDVPDDFPQPLPIPNCIVSLPGGWRDANGIVQIEAEVREFTGKDEEYISKIKDSSKYVTAILSRGVIRVGDTHNLSDRQLDDMFLGDRDSLLLAIRRVTYGDEMELTIICPNCETKDDIAVDLLDFPTKVWGNHEEDSFKVKTTKEYLMSPVRGFMSNDIISAGLKNKSMTVAELNTMLLSKTIIMIDNFPISEDKELVRNLSSRDRKLLLEELVKHQPGPQWNEVAHTCINCGSEFKLAIDILAPFRF